MKSKLKNNGEKEGIHVITGETVNFCGSLTITI
jgi:hypothetical protein